MKYTNRKRKHSKRRVKSYRNIKSSQRGGTNQIPIFIICWNQYTYVKSTVDQLQAYDKNMKIYIIDNFCLRKYY